MTTKNIKILAKELSAKKLSSIIIPFNWLAKAKLAYFINKNKDIAEQELNDSDIHWLWLWLTSKLGLFFILFMALTFQPSVNSLLGALKFAFTPEFTDVIMFLENNVLFQLSLFIPLLAVILIFFIVSKNTTLSEKLATKLGVDMTATWKEVI